MGHPATAVVLPDWSAVRDEATRHLQALIRFDTTNPPGNETPAAAYIVETLRAEGITAEVVESAPGRGNAVARLQSANPTAPPILLMGHTDVVSVERDKWTRDPFGGDLVEGFVWGRGAVDMKSQVAAELTALLLLKRSGQDFERDITLVAFADEETGGGDHGAAWMWAHRRDLLDAEYAINEGGGEPIEVNGRRFYLCQAGEKGNAHLRVTARAAPGHASIPLDDTAMLRLGRALVRLHEWQPPAVVTPPMRALLATLAPAFGPEGEATVAAILANPTWDALAALPFDADVRAGLRASVHNTAVPTIVHGGHRLNVIPSEVTLELDGRILPGQDPDDWRAEVQAALGDDVEVTLVSGGPGLAADPASPFFDAIAATIADLDPGAAVAPYLVSGGTDAAHLPGIKVYGFFPPASPARNALYTGLMHGHDERYAVEDLLFGTRFVYELVTRFCGER